MFSGSPRLVASGLLSAALAGSVIALAAADDQVAQVAHKPKPQAAHAAPVKAHNWLAGFDPLVHQVAGDHLEAALADGAHAQLSLDPALQGSMEKLFEQYSVPYGALVALEPATGRVLAYVSHSSANPNAGDLALDATPPAASVFKVITSSALLDAGVTPETQACYGGGLSKLSQRDIDDDPRRDRSCASLAQALGGSINAVFAKLADKHLDPKTLRARAEAFGFGQPLTFDVATTPSPIDVPAERLEFARTAAGFWHMHMSPLHGALLAATVADGGSMPRASLVDRVLDANGRLVQSRKPEAPHRVISEATAHTVGKMMLRTVTEGTAHSAFFDEHGQPFLPNIDVAGKTGSLSAEQPYRAYSWWIGFAPADKPTIALAALVVNTPKWRIKGSFVAREALRQYLVEEPAKLRKVEKAAIAAATVTATPTPVAAPVQQVVAAVATSSQPLPTTQPTQPALQPTSATQPAH